MGNVLVTGGTGFTGSHLIKKLLERGNDVVTISRGEKQLTSLKALGLENKVNMVKGDILDHFLLQRVLSEYQIDTVYHTAAVTIVSKAQRSPIVAYETNVMGTVTLLEACRTVGVKAILVASTDKVYGDLPTQKEGVTLSYEENFPLNPKGIYESSKAMMDIAARAYAHIYELPIVVSRACNIYGEADFNPRVIPNTIRSCLRGENPTIFKDVTYKREYIYVDDVVNAYINLVDNIERTKGKAYNIGSGDLASQEAIVRMVLKHFPNLEPRYVEPKPYMKKEIKDQFLSSSRIWNELRWKAKIDLREGIDKTVRWWKKYERTKN